MSPKVTLLLLEVAEDCSWVALPPPPLVLMPWHPVRKDLRCGLSTMPVSCWSALIRSFGSRRLCKYELKIIFCNKKKIGHNWIIFFVKYED
jgi:hypothetical protein